MVRLYNPKMNGLGPDALPIMPVHRLKAVKKTKTFEVDEIGECFITIMSDGRYSIMDADFLNYQKHYQVFTEKELHDSFEDA